MLIDLHNHTALCNHAEGSVDEYVQAAIQNGVRYFGFSDHAPMDFDPAYRMHFDQMALYENWVHTAKEKYKDSITVLLGYEIDYLPGSISEKVLERNADFFIGSVHFLGKWGFDNPEFIGRYKNKNIDAVWQEYFDAVEKMAKSGKFDIVGHLDLIKVFKFLPKKDVRLIAANALKAIKEAGLVIEINSSGLRKPIHEPYPSKALLEEAYALDIPITFGSDAHKPGQIGMFEAEALHLAKEVGYTQCALFEQRERSFLNF
jgi:histidinol-phosphatase (PHP family)